MTRPSDEDGTADLESIMPAPKKHVSTGDSAAHDDGEPKVLRTRHDGKPVDVEKIRDSVMRRFPKIRARLSE